MKITFFVLKVIVPVEACKNNVSYSVTFKIFIRLRLCIPVSKSDFCNIQL